MSCLDVRNICYPLLIGTLRVKLSVEQIGVFVQASTVIAVFLATNHRKQIVFLHYSKYILLFMSVDYHAFYAYPHFLSNSMLRYSSHNKTSYGSTLILP